MRIFSEVSSDFLDTETGKIAIDGYFPGDEAGVTVAWVDKNGVITMGDNSQPQYLGCELVLDELSAVITLQLLSRKLVVKPVIKAQSKKEFAGEVANVLTELASLSKKLNMCWENDHNFKIDLNEQLTDKYPFPESFEEMDHLIQEWVSQANKNLSHVKE